MHRSAGYMTMMEEDIQPKELQRGSDSTVTNRWESLVQPSRGQ